jgi:hypothetical protein
MAAVESFLTEDAASKKRRLKMLVSILIGVVLLHVGVGVIAGIFIVARYIFPAPANFVVKKDIRLPAKKREHKMNMAALDAIAPKPTLSDKMQSTRPTAFSLPDVPEMPLDQMLPLDPSQLVADQVASLSNSEAMGTASGAAAAGSGGFGGKGLSFLGVESAGQRILMAFDVSSSVKSKAEKSGIPFSKIKQETLELIKNLPITARFGIIQFSRAYKPFSVELVPASQGNRAAANLWIENEWVESGLIPSSGKGVSSPNGFVGVLELAAKMQPDVVFIISDGSFQSSIHPSAIPWSEVRQAADAIKDSEGKQAKINIIAFEPKEEDFKELRRLSARYGGKAIELKK